MKLLKKIPEAVMVAAYLRAELNSPRFSKDIKEAMRSLGVNERIIANPNLLDTQENVVRANVLGRYRGYGENREMFVDVPNNLTWYEAEMQRGEIGDLHYVDYSYWNELTEGTHLVKDGVKNIRKGKIVFDVPNDRFFEVANKVGYGKDDFEPIIVWGQNAHSPLVILEGHLRATAYGLAATKTPGTIKLIVGLIA